MLRRTTLRRCPLLLVTNRLTIFGRRQTRNKVLASVAKERPRKQGFHSRHRFSNSVDPNWTVSTFSQCCHSAVWCLTQSRHGGWAPHSNGSGYRKRHGCSLRGRILVSTCLHTYMITLDCVHATCHTIGTKRIPCTIPRSIAVSRPYGAGLTNLMTYVASGLPTRTAQPS